MQNTLLLIVKKMNNKLKQKIPKIKNPEEEYVKALEDFIEIKIDLIRNIEACNYYYVLDIEKKKYKPALKKLKETVRKLNLTFDNNSVKIFK